MTNDTISKEDSLTQKWICTACGDIYDPMEGDPEGGIPPQTPFSKLPDGWVCPVCGAAKSAFEPYDED